MGAYRYFAFGYNRWKQKPMRIACPGGFVTLERERDGGSVVVRVTSNEDKVPGGSGRIAVTLAPSGHTVTVRIVYEETSRV